MEKKRTLSFSLSQEELFVALRYLNILMMEGLDNKILAELNEREQKLVLGAAERSLVARGFLIPNMDHKFTLSDPVLALIISCARPEKSIIINSTIPNGPRQTIYFHSARKMRVMHTIPIIAIHQFIAVEDDLAFGKAILSLLRLSEIKSNKSQEGKVIAGNLLAARDSALAGNLDKAIKMLSKTLDPGTAENLAEAFAHPILYSDIQYIPKNTGRDRQTSFSIVQGKSSLWLLDGHDLDHAPSKEVHIHSVSSDELAQKIKSF